MTEALGMTPRRAGGLVFAMAGVAGGCEGVYAALEASPSPWYMAAYLAVFLWALTLWLEADCHARGVPVLFDQGLFVYLFSFILLPVHLLRTRGVAGVVPVVAFVAVFFVSFYTSLGVSFLVAGVATG